MSDITLSPGQVAGLFGVSVASVRKWEKQGRITAASITLGGHRRYNQTDIMEIYNRQNTKEVKQT